MVINGITMTEKPLISRSRSELYCLSIKLLGKIIWRPACLTSINRNINDGISAATNVIYEAGAHNRDSIYESEEG